ncbi:hypothetical protein G9A89_013679 [Geosiphon pyriformis]|nr:hypothetical protein G9A89_013679 [Geosiphon pyriformis]
MAIQNNKASGTINYVLLVENNYLTKECGTTFLDEEKHVSCRTLITTAWHQAIFHLDGYPHNKDKFGTMSSKILTIKNNPSKPVNIVLIFNLNTFLDVEADSKEFHEHYQNLAPTREEQKQHLEEINL